MKNFQNNLKGIFRKPGEPDPLDARNGQQAAPEQPIDHDAYEEVAHVEFDKENVGEVINIQMQKDFFGHNRSTEPESGNQSGISPQKKGKPPMPGRSNNFSLNQAKGASARQTNGSGHTPERTGMVVPMVSKPPAGPASIFSGRRELTEKQKQAAAMRQNALRYGNSRGSANLRSAGGSGSRPRSSN